jgi:hypothetical protein
MTSHNEFLTNVKQEITFFSLFVCLHLSQFGNLNMIYKFWYNPSNILCQPKQPQEQEWHDQKILKNLNSYTICA